MLALMDAPPDSEDRDREMTDPTRPDEEEDDAAARHDLSSLNIANIYLSPHHDDDARLDRTTIIWIGERMLPPRLQKALDEPRESAALGCPTTTTIARGDIVAEEQRTAAPIFPAERVSA